MNRTWPPSARHLAGSGSGGVVVLVSERWGAAGASGAKRRTVRAARHDGRVTGVEMLARWHHPRLGLLAPGAFVPLAEQTGLDRPMTAWVLNAAHGVPADGLVIEITESGLFANTSEAARVLRALSSLGVKVSVDDFGTGFSSLSRLRRLPVDEIKIDRSFVGTMLADADDHAIVRSVVTLGRDLGLRCVAEGVEDQATYAAVKRLGCDVAQGFLFSPPLPVDELTAWLADDRATVG